MKSGVATVYHFKVYDVTKDDFRIPQLKSTLERIERIKGTPIESTAEDVPIADLDADGRYDPALSSGPRTAS